MCIANGFCPYQRNRQILELSSCMEALAWHGIRSSSHWPILLYCLMKNAILSQSLPTGSHSSHSRDNCKLVQIAMIVLQAERHEITSRIESRQQFTRQVVEAAPLMPDADDDR